MRFSWKVFVCTMIVVAVSFGIGGYLLITSVFDTVIGREIRQSLEANQMIHFAFETAVLNLPSPNSNLHDYTIVHIFKTLEFNQLTVGRLIRLSDENFKALYTTADIESDKELLDAVQRDTWCYRIIYTNDNYYLHIVGMVNMLDRRLYLETVNNINSIYADRERQFEIYEKFMLIILFFSAVIMLLISTWLTKPIGLLSEAAKNIANGNFTKRIANPGKDEIGVLIRDFNSMTDALEEKIYQLQEAARRQEDFVGSFAHELKTPLTAMIGYADMLRSYKLDSEKQFQAANYIFEEGRRLENLSLKLTDIILYERKAIVKHNISVATLFESITHAFATIMTENNLNMEVKYDKATINVESDLLKTLLVNLIDNARKASEPGSLIQVFGERTGTGYYLFYVKDNGSGIPPEDINKITEAFYMVDKSRSRSQSGSGLGLALCAKIAELHGTTLCFESELGVGTKVSFCIEEEC